MFSFSRKGLQLRQYVSRYWDGSRFICKPIVLQILCGILPEDAGRCPMSTLLEAFK